jgi:hypothetical protein
MTTSRDTTDRGELLSQIATAEENGRWAEAMRLKSQLHPAPEPNPERDAEVATLKDHIAKLEAAGRFAAAAPLKTKLAKLASR